MAELVIRISGDIKNYEEALAKAEKETGSLSDALSSVAEKSAIAFAALTAEIGLAVAAYKESEQAVNRLSAALQSQGIYSQALVDSYSEQADELQALTGLSDEAIIAAQTSIQAYLGQTEITKELTAAIADLSVAKGMDLQSTAELIGKGINGQTAALKKAGIEIDDNLTKQERLAQIIDKVSLAYGGQAAAAAKGLGALNILKESFSNLQEELGKRFAPIIERVAKSFIEFFDRISNNQKLIDLAAGLLGAATAAAAMTAALATLAVAALAANAAMTALGVTTVVALAPYIAIAAAVIAAAAALGYYATQSSDAGPKSKSLGDKISELKSDIDGLNETLERNKKLGPASVADAELQRSVDQKRNQVDQLEAQLERQMLLEEKARAAGAGTGQNAAQKEAADRAAAERDRRQSLELASKREHDRALLLESQRASESEVALANERSALLMAQANAQTATEKAALQAKLDDNETLQMQYTEREKELKRQAFYEDLALNEEYQAMDEEQKAAFRVKNEAAYMEARLSENQAREQAAKERQDIQVREHNTFLLNQQKFGTAYATINQIMNSTIVQGSAKAFGELAALQTSSNSTLKGIGKIAATATIIIKTAESAMNIYAGFSPIPIIGPALGAAGAAAAVAFGAEQIGKVNAAAEGGLLEGGIPGVDSIPVLAQQGELVVPRQNFDEVVGAVSNQRGGGEGGQQGQAPGPVEIVLTLKDDLMEFIETQFNERDALGISVRSART